MFRYCAQAGTAVAAVLAPSPVFAHVGHVGELAGHSHWVGVAALAGAVLVAGWAALKARKDKKDTDEPAEEAKVEDETEAPA